MATEKDEIDYLRVFFNDLKLPVLKEWVPRNGHIIKREILEYDQEKNLIRRYILDENSKPKEIIQYGEFEPWSIEYRKTIFKPDSKFNYMGQRSEFSVNQDNQIMSVQFITIGGHHYGEIQFIYDHLGLLIGENWLSLPQGKSVKKYAYSYDLISQERQLWEYGPGGEEISHVSMSFANQDSLYKYPPPRTGNRLDEVALILEDINNFQIDIPDYVFIPKFENDLLFLLSGERLDINFLMIQNRQVHFSLLDSPEKLVLPLNRVSKILDEFGENIFPE